MKPPMKYNQLREWLSNLEHIQWEHWSKAVGKELHRIQALINKGKNNLANKMIIDRLVRWEKNWKPYSKLTEEVKEFDREWADKILDEVPFKCPLHQCGGLMITKERDPPNDLRKFPKEHHYEYDGDEQSPDLICTNCKAVYQFKGMS